MFNYQFLNLVHKTVFSPYLLPSIFQNCFIPTRSIHGYETRHNKLYLTHVTTKFGQRILRYKGTQLWNRLPNFYVWGYCGILEGLAFHSPLSSPLYFSYAFC